MERTPKGKKKNKVASVFCIVLACILVFETIILNIIWIPAIIKRNKKDSELIVFARENPGIEAVEQAEAICLRQYIYARLIEEELVRYEENTEDYTEFMALANEVQNAWNQCAIYCDALDRMAAMLIVEENKPGYCATYAESQIVYNDTKEFEIHDPFAITAQAKGKSEELKFAETLTRVFDAGPRGEKIKNVADYLGTDAKTAKEAFDNSMAYIYSTSQADAEAYHKWYISCKVAASAGKVAGVVASGGAALAAGGALATAGLVIAGADAAVSVAETTCEITLGEKHTVTKVLDDAESYTSILAAGSNLLSFKSANAVDKILTIAGTSGDLTQGKFVGGALDVDSSGQVKLFAWTFNKDADKKSKKKYHDQMIRDISRRLNKYDGRYIFNNKEEISEGVAAGVEKYIENEKNGITTEDRKLSAIPKEELDVLVEENKPELPDEEIMQIMNDLEAELNRAVTEGDMLNLSEDDDPYIIAPTLDDIDGAWEFTISYSDLSSKLVEAIADGLDSTFGEGTSDAALENRIDEKESVTIHAYVNIEKQTHDTAKVTMITDDDGEWTYSVYSGKMKEGVLSMKLESYSTSQAIGISEGVDKMDFEFYGYKDERYSSGTYEMTSFALNATVDYYGQRVYENDYWEFIGE